MHETLTLRPLSAEDGRDIYGMLQEMPAIENGLSNPCHDVSYEEYQAWLGLSVEHAAGQNLPEGYVPYSMFWLYAGEKPVGLGQLRHYLNDKLRRNSGHIGYGIRPTARGKGYGSALLSLLLDEAAKLGIAQALITVNTDNQPSLGVVRNNGGEVAETIDDKHLFRLDTALSKKQPPHLIHNNSSNPRNPRLV